MKYSVFFKRCWVDSVKFYWKHFQSISVFWFVVALIDALFHGMEDACFMWAIMIICSPLIMAMSLFILGVILQLSEL